jgi:Sulfotransferase domain
MGAATFGTLARWSATQAKSLALAANYYCGHYREVVWLIGDGRSGTTWVASLINHEQRYREMFEPFHPRVLEPARGFLPNQYIRPDDSRDTFQAAAADVFSGRLTHTRVDADTRPGIYKGLLIKDIFANLFARWALQRFPGLRIVLLVRNPFAVAVSKLHKRQWCWTVDPLDLLNQPDLRDDYLQPFEDVIRRVSGRNDYIQNQILIWSILNYVPLLQFRAEQLHVVFYEDVCGRPDEEVSRIVSHTRPDDVGPRATISPEIVRKPSRVTAPGSAVMAGASPIDSWRREVTPAQIEAGLGILAHFGLDGLYRLDSTPNRDRLEDVRQHGARALLR